MSAIAWSLSPQLTLVSFLSTKKEAKLTYVLTWSFTSAADLLFPWRQAVSWLLLNGSRIKIRRKSKKSLERYLQRRNRDSPLKAGGRWFKSQQNKQQRSWLKVQRWLRKRILEKRCGVIPLGSKYWVMFSPQTYIQLSVTSTQTKGAIRGFKREIQFPSEIGPWREFRAFYAIGTLAEVLKEGKFRL